MERGHRDGSILGRSRQITELRAALGATLGGEGARRLALEGDLGAGKTTLLRHLTAEAESDGMTVISVTGSEAEQDLPMAGLHLIAVRTQSVWPALPPSSAAALEGILHGGLSRLAIDQYTYGVALLDAFAASAERNPLMVAVDDLQWFDSVSQGALLFACRRLQAEAVTVLVALRTGTVSLPGEFSRVTVDGLDHADAAELLRRNTDTDVTDAVAVEIADAVGGNPLALIESTSRLAPDQLRGERPLPPTLPIGATLAGGFLERMGPLRQDERLALAVVAAAGSATTSVAPALRDLDLDLTVLDRAVDAGVLVHGDDGLEFGHPLMRSALVDALAPDERRRVHAALAEVCEDPPRLASHLIAASSGPSDELGDRLWAMAIDHLGRSGLVAAAPLVHQAAWATPPGPARIERLLRAGEAWSNTGNIVQARQCWRAAAEQASDEDQQIEAELLALRAAVWSEGLAGVVERTRTIGDRCAADAPDRAVHAYVSGTIAAIALGFPDELATFVDDIERLGADGQAPDREAIKSLVIRAQLILGRRRAVEAEALTAAEVLTDQLRSGHPLDELLVTVACALPQALLWCERFDESETVTNAAIARFRAEGLTRPMAYPYTALCELHMWRGDLERGLAIGEMAMELTRQTARPALAVYTGGLLARMWAWRGAEDTVSQLLAEHTEVAEEMGLAPARVFLSAAAGALALTLERHREAVTILSGAAALNERIGLVEVTVVPFEPDLIEALIRTGDRRTAEERLDRFQARVDATGSPWGSASCSRLRGLLDDDSEMFAKAVKELGNLPFDRARALLGWGELLRRRRRHQESRVHLLDAAATFDALGATPWAQRARRELVAAGYSTATPPADHWPTLTNQERQVALAVVDGLSNREVAERLFLSTKTVEYHLTRVFRKLGLRSRAQLQSRYAAQAGAAERQG